MKSIRELRQDRGWTQHELALKIGVQAQAVYLWESGRRTPQVPQMRKLGEIFDVCSDLIVLDVSSDPSKDSSLDATNTIEANTTDSPDPSDTPRVS